MTISEKATMLVVDDEPSMLCYLRAVLEATSYRVETAESGSEAGRADFGSRALSLSCLKHSSRCRVCG